MNYSKTPKHGPARDEALNGAVREALGTGSKPKPDTERPTEQTAIDKSGERDFLRRTRKTAWLLEQIDDLDSTIGRDMDALSRAESKQASANLWARIHRKRAARSELCEQLPGPPPQD